MRSHSLVAAALCLLLTAAGVAAEPVRSGLQPGQKITTIFEPVNVNGPFAGNPHCLVCENGANPVVMIFAREVSQPLVKLLGRLDAATAQHAQADLGSFVVFLSDKEGLDEELQQTVARGGLKRLIVSHAAPAGPEGFEVSAEADVTVVLYVEHQVKANHARRKGAWTDRDSDRVLADLAKILPAK